MVDLVEKYFQEDMDPKEQEELAQELLHSEDAAFKFSRLAREAYLSFGLPEPENRWPDEPGPQSAKPGSLWGWILAAALLLGVFQLKAVQEFYGHWLSKWIHGGVLGGQVTPSQQRGLSLSRLNTRPGKAWRTEEEKDRGTFTPKPVLSHGAEVGMLGDNRKIQSTQSFPNLSVVLDQAEAASVQVSVLDPEGNLVRALHQGLLPSGHWVFTWNGLLADGKKPRPGIYQIQVQSGIFSQRKTVQIR
ncbi:MAG: FlgD immunoglobulin-like domain containing protein [bacterium]